MEEVFGSKETAADLERARADAEGYRAKVNATKDVKEYEVDDNSK